MLFTEHLHKYTLTEASTFYQYSQYYLILSSQLSCRVSFICLLQLFLTFAGFALVWFALLYKFRAAATQEKSWYSGS